MGQNSIALCGVITHNCLQLHAHANGIGNVLCFLLCLQILSILFFPKSFEGCSTKNKPEKCQNSVTVFQHCMHLLNFLLMRQCAQHEAILMYSMLGCVSSVTAKNQRLFQCHISELIHLIRFFKTHTFQGLKVQQLSQNVWYSICKSGLKTWFQFEIC